jgi:hypothetical protein
MKRWLAAAAALLLLTTLPVTEAVAQDGDTGSIGGRVVNGTDDGGPVADQEVVLQGVSHGEEATILPPQVTRTDAEGGFRFDGLPLAEENSFLVFVTYGDIEYQSRDVKLTPEAPSADLDMEVYESTTTDGAVRVALDHIVLEADAQAQMVNVLEAFQVVNDSDHAYVSAAEDTEGGPTLQFSLPSDATQVSVISGVEPQDLIRTATGLADTNPLVPGEKEVALAYGVPYAESDLIFEKTLPYPTDRITILVKDDGLSVSSPALSAPDPVDMGDASYVMLTGDSLPAGTPIEVSLSGLPSASSGDGGGTDVLLPLLAIGLAAALGLAVLYPRLRRRAAQARGRGEQD